MDRMRRAGLAGRVGRLERELRLWRSLALAALVALGAAALFGAPGGGPAAASEDKEYTIAVPPEVFQMGQPQLVGEVRARRVVLVDARGEPRGALQVSAGGTPSLELFGPSGRAQATLSVKGSGAPSLVLTDRMGRVLWQAP